MVDMKRDRPHLHIEGGGEKELYTSPKRGDSGLPPARVRAAHARKLEHAIGNALSEARRKLEARDETIAEGERGFYLEFEIPTAERTALDGLENKPKSIELVAVRLPEDGGELISATVFVPEKSADFFVKKIEAYRDEDTRTGKPKNEALVARIEDIRLAALRSLFTDDMTLFPQAGRQAWWEVWLREDRLGTFRTVAERLNVVLKEHIISFPERDVVLVLANESTMVRLVGNTDAIAELRIAKDTPSLFLEMGAVEQVEWAADLAERSIRHQFWHLRSAFSIAGRPKDTFSLRQASILRISTLTIIHGVWGIVLFGTAMALRWLALHCMAISKRH